MKVGDYSSSLQKAYSDYRQATLQVSAESTASSSTDKTADQSATSSAITQDDELSQHEQNRVKELKTTDAHVRAHEAAHLAAAGGLAKSGANYTYTKGPDGKLYATGGEVSIDTSKTDSPETTIQKMARVRAAALAPSDPSAQDRSVAAKASQISAQAALELSAYNRQGQSSQPSSRPGQHINTAA